MDPFQEYEDGEVFSALMAVELKNAMLSGISKASGLIFVFHLISIKTFFICLAFGSNTAL